MSMGTSYSCFGCVEFALDARTLAYHRWACETGRYETMTLGANRIIRNLLCPCPADDAPFTNPIDDQVCWYDPLIPESADFLGVIVRKIEGLRKSTLRREVLDGMAGGSILMQPFIGGKQLGFEVYILATSCAGMDYGIEWLRRQFEDDNACPSDASLCTSCQGRLMTIRTSCPVDPEAVSFTGLRSFAAAATIDGIDVVEDDFPLGPSMCCVLRRATFTIQTESAKSYSTLPVSECSITAADDELFNLLGNCADPTEAPEWEQCCPICGTGCDPCTYDPACDCLPPLVIEPVTVQSTAPCFTDPLCRLVGGIGIGNVAAGYETALRLSLFAGSAPLNPAFQKFGMRNVVIRIWENPELLPTPDDLETYEALAERYRPCAELGVSWMPSGSELIIDGMSAKTWLKCNGRCVDHSSRVHSISGSVFPLTTRCTNLIVTAEWDTLNVVAIDDAPNMPSSLTVEAFQGFRL